MPGRNVMTQDVGQGLFREDPFDAPAMEHRSCRRYSPNPAADITLDATDITLNVVTAAGAIAVYLPTAVSRPGKVYRVKNWDGTNAVTVWPAPNMTPAQTIDGMPNIPLALKGDVIQVESDGIDWLITSCCTEIS